MAELRKHCMSMAGPVMTSLNIAVKHMVQEPQYFPELPHTYAK